MKKGNTRTEFCIHLKNGKIREFLFMLKLQNCVATDPQHQQGPKGSKN
jgi:hypothetical protein